MQQHSSKLKKSVKPRPGAPSNLAPARRTALPAARVIVWPKDVESRYGISMPTRWRWEKDGKLPPRDVFIGGVAKGWRPETLDAADSGKSAAA